MSVIKKTSFERADLVRCINTGKFGVSFRKKEYPLKAKNWEDAQIEAEKLLDKMSPDITIIVD